MSDLTTTIQRVLDPNRRTDLANTVRALLDQREAARDAWQRALDARHIPSIDAGESGFWSVTRALRDVLENALDDAPDLARALVAEHARVTDLEAQLAAAVARAEALRDALHLRVLAVQQQAALLDAADLANPETLRFVRVVGAMPSTSRAIAADGEVYTIYFAAGGEWGFDCSDLRRPVYPFATEEKAIETAREHDRARRGAK